LGVPTEYSKMEERRFVRHVIQDLHDALRILEPQLILENSG